MTNNKGKVHGSIECCNQDGRKPGGPGPVAEDQQEQHHPLGTQAACTGHTRHHDGPDVVNGCGIVPKPGEGRQMNYYQFHIGDYMSHTRHLSAMEDLAYRRLLDIYYLHEQPLDEDATSVARMINMREAVLEVETILEEFFEFQVGRGWVNLRADEEISKYRLRLEANSRAGKISAERRMSASSTSVQPTKNHKPITNEKKNIKKKSDLTVSTEVDPRVWDDFLKIRAAKKSPLTSTAIEQIKREADKAGWSLNQALTECVARGWQGFKAEWVNKPGGQGRFDPVAFVNQGRAKHVVIDITPSE